MKELTRYKVIGLMSGTSLDGLDIAYCFFRKEKTGWSYSIGNAVTLKYSSTWLKKLSGAHLLSGEDLCSLHAEFGNYLAKATQEFIDKYKLKPDFISSHGHTIFHQPEKARTAGQPGFTYQAGNGNSIHAVTGLPVVYNFRDLDVALGGEGAPLVPAGDKFLFSQYDVCLNLGGIANLSRDIGKKRAAFDICFCNMGLNYLMNSIGKEYDEGGSMASEGEINKPLLRGLNRVYEKLRGKRPSLGREIFEKQIKPLVDNEAITLKDRLRTLTESAASEIATAILAEGKSPKVLCTGGGTFNSFLISRILEHCADNATLIIPEEDVIKFKEAMVFAFLGVLKVRGEVNCLKSVTGATRDSCSGVITGF